VTRLAVFSVDDLFHRLLWQAVGETDDMQIDVRLRAPGQFNRLSAIDVLVLDRPAPDETAAAINEIPSDAGVVVLTDAGMIQKMTTVLGHVGAAFSVLPAYAEAATVLAASRAVADGLFVFHEPPGGAATAGGDPAESRVQPTELTGRELEVVLLLAHGSSNAEIASRLSISENTVKYHLSAIYGTLGVHRRGEAVIEAVRRGLISL
jgi:DNA-binding NarL/FixJ family response regulator